MSIITKIISLLFRELPNSEVNDKELRVLLNDNPTKIVEAIEEVNRTNIEQVITINNQKFIIKRAINN